MDSPRQSSPPSAAPPPVKLSSFASFPRTALESTRALVKRRDNIDVAGMQEEGDLNTPLPEQLGGSDLSRKKQKHSRKHKHKHGDKKRRKKDSASSSRHKHGRRGSSDDDSDVSVPDNVTGDMAERDSAIHEEDTSSLFYVDRRGDHENVTVQRTDPARVPKYRRMREDLLVADAHAVAIVGKDVPKSGPARTAVPQTPSADFIAVEDATVATTAFVEDTTSTSTFTHGPLLLRQQQFNAHLTRNPHDIPEWLRFLHFQEELFASQPIHRERAAALREKKLAIVERALAVNAGSMRLWRVYLELFAGGRGVGAEEMNLKWREVLHKADVAESERDTGDTRSTHLALWLEYISFQQRQRPGFRYGRCRDTIAEALRHFCDDGPSALKLLRRLIALDVQCGRLCVTQYASSSYLNIH